MSKTQLSGDRIANKSIGQNHLKDDIKIPERNLQLNYPTHKHENKSALDIIFNSNPTLAKEIDLKDVLLTMLQVSQARDTGLTLKNTINKKCDYKEFEELKKMIDEAVGERPSLKDALESFNIYLDDKLNKHIGLVSHSQLDNMYNEVEIARGIYPTLGERLNDIILNSGSSSDGSSNVNISILSPWHCDIELKAGETIIDLPNPYTLGEQSLQVWENCCLLTPGEENDYIEINQKQIELNNPIDEDTIVSIIGTNAGRLFDWCIRTKSHENQVEIDTIYKYRLNYDDLVVYEDGIRLFLNEDYKEKNNKTIVMLEPLPANCNITICKRRY